MSIAKTDQIKLEGLNNTAKTLLRVGTPLLQLKIAMKEDIASFEKETGLKLQFNENCKDGNWFTTNGYSRNFAFTKKPNEVRFINARINDVVISANFYKPQTYNHDNAHVAQALRILADKIEKSSIRLADYDVTLIDEKK